VRIPTPYLWVRPEIEVAPLCVQDPSKQLNLDQSHSDQAKQIVEATLEAGESMTLIVCGEPREFGRDKALVVATERPNGAKAHYSSYTHPVG
jgi:hypothetical protein